MKSTTLKTLLFGLFLVVAVGVKAQEADKYEYVIVRQRGISSSFYVSFEGGATEIIKTDPKDIKYETYTSLLNKVSELKAQGWKVSSTNGGDNTVTFILKREKK